jgi:hypothetical protein
MRHKTTSLDMFVTFQSYLYISLGNMRRDGLSLGMFGVGDGITDHSLEEALEDSSGLLINQSGDTFDTTSSSKTTDCWLGDSLDVITQD